MAALGEDIVFIGLLVSTNIKYCCLESGQIVSNEKTRKISTERSNTCKETYKAGGKTTTKPLSRSFCLAGVSQKRTYSRLPIPFCFSLLVHKRTGSHKHFASGHTSALDAHTYIHTDTHTQTHTSPVHTIAQCDRTDEANERRFCKLCCTAEKAVLKCKFFHRRRYTEKVALCVRLPAANRIQSAARNSMQRITTITTTTTTMMTKTKTTLPAMDPIRLHKKLSDRLTTCIDAPPSRPS